MTTTTEFANKHILGHFIGISMIRLQLEFTKEYYSTEDSLRFPQIEPPHTEGMVLLLFKGIDSRCFRQYIWFSL